MRQRELAGHVPDGVDAGGGRPHRVVDRNEAAFDRDAGLFEAEGICVAAHADADQHLVRGQLLRLAAHADGDLGATVSDRHTLDPRPRAKGDALLFEGALKLDADRLVLEWQEVVEQLHDRHVHAIRVVEVRELSPDRPAADDHERLWWLAQFKSLAARDHRRAVDLDARQR